jgi:ribonuclease P protein component
MASGPACRLWAAAKLSRRVAPRAASASALKPFEPPLAQLARLKRRQEFLAVAASGRKFVAPGLILQARKQPTDGSPSAEPVDSVGHETALRVGFTASRKVGNAVARNRARRRLKAASETIMRAHAAPHHDYVLVARAGTLTRAYGDLLADLSAGLKHLKLYRTRH